MIIKGKSRAEPVALAAHLGNAEKNERVQLLETRGTIAEDLRGALIEMNAYAVGTRCEKPLYHAALSPEPPHCLTSEQRNDAVNALEEKLGLSGHARIVVMHEKLGREHVHVVWSRIDLENMRSVSDSHNYRRHEEVSRDLERRFGHDRVQGAHHERDGVERPDRTPSRAELRQEERTGITGKQVKAEVSELFRGSDGPEAFRAALADKGYLLANGDRRDFVVFDKKGGIHSLARRLDGVKAAELRTFMEPLDRESLPSVAEVREKMQRFRQQRADHFENRLEGAYAKGDSFASQSNAAQMHHERRQKALDRWLSFQPPVPDPERFSAENTEQRQRQDPLNGLRLETPEAILEKIDRGRVEQERRRQEVETTERTRIEEPRESSSGFNLDSVEITDRMAEILGDFGGESERSRSLDDPPGRERGTSDGGRSRGR